MESEKYSREKISLFLSALNNASGYPMSDSIEEELGFNLEEEIKEEIKGVRHLSLGVLWD